MYVLILSIATVKRFSSLPPIIRSCLFKQRSPHFPTEDFPSGVPAQLIKPAIEMFVLKLKRTHVLRTRSKVHEDNDYGMYTWMHACLFLLLLLWLGEGRERGNEIKILVC